ncbi:MAG: Phenylacetic acid catabolic protein, partial [Rhodobiaceae bacterium]
DLVPYIGEMFESDDTAARLVAAGLLPDPTTVRAAFDSTVARTFTMAQLPPLEISTGISGGRAGRHGEVLGHLLAEMQFMQRAYPGLTW